MKTKVVLICSTLAALAVGFVAGQTNDQLRNALVGKWKLVGTKSIKFGQFFAPDPNHSSFKTLTLPNWANVTYDSSSNVVYAVGGPYSFDGNVLTETIKTESGSKIPARASELLGAHVPFRIRVVGDDYYQIGADSRSSVEQQWHRIGE